MSNLVETNQMPNPQASWGNPPPNVYRNPSPKVQNEIVKQQIPINVIPQASGVSNFTEHTSKVTVFFNGKLKDMKSKCISKCMTATAAEAVFKPQSGLALHSVPLAADKGVESKVDLSKVIITGMGITSTFNKFPFAVKFDWTGQGETANCFDMNGKQAPLMLFPGEQSRGHFTQISSARDAVNDPLLRKYGHVSLKEMWEKIQLVSLPNGQKIAYVPRDHDALKLIALNPQRFGPHPTEDDVVHNSLFKMAPEQIGAAIDEMYTNILCKFNFHDLTKFKVNMYREDDKEFDDLSGSEWDCDDAADKEDALKKSVCAGFDLQITWTSPQQNGNQAKPVNVMPQNMTIASNSVTPAVSPQFNVFQSTTYNSSTKIPVTGPRV